jgi:hypothetical protein
MAGMPPDMVFGIAALVAYRSEQWAAAKDLLQLVNHRGENPPPILTPLRALVHYRLNEHDLAQQELEKAMMEHHDWAVSLISEEVRSPWQDGLEGYLLLNEASRLIQGKAVPIDTSIQEWQVNERATLETPFH